MKNLLFISLSFLLITSCKYAQKAGLTFEHKPDLVKVIIGNTTTKKQLDSLSANLIKDNIRLEITELQYNNKGLIQRLSIFVDSGLGHTGSASSGNLKKSYSYYPLSFQVDKSKNSPIPFCIGADDCMK